MDKKLWQIDADQLTEFGDIVSYSVRMYAKDAGAAWMTFTRSFHAGTRWYSISVHEAVKRSE